MFPSCFVDKFSYTNKYDPRKLYTELPPINDTIVSLKLRAHKPHQSLQILLKLGSEHNNIQLFTDNMKVTSCKSSNDAIGEINHIKEIMVVHQHQISLGSDISKLSNEGFTVEATGIYPIIKYKYEIPGGVDHQYHHVYFKIFNQNVTQTSPNDVIARETFIKFMSKLAN